MKQQVYKRVFILGSGFSKSFCPELPTLKDLNSLLPLQIPEEFSHLKAYCERLSKLCNGEADYLNIESLATAILSAQIFPSETESLYHSALRFELLRFIASTIRVDGDLNADAENVLVNFLQNVSNAADAANGKTLLLSFNYDTLIEDCLNCHEEFADTSIDFGLNIESADRKTCKVAKKHVDLMKLHGSLEWFPLKGSGNSLDVQNICRVQRDDKSYPIYENDTPVFIPMAHSKESFLRGSLFNILWAKADYYLSNADEIYCIGYGFPKTDVNNLEFLLKHRERIKNVVVYEKESHPDLERLRRLFGEKIVSSDACDFLKDLPGESTACF